jgi:xanthine dehydrogenase YagS FAD-binding subunit
MKNFGYARAADLSEAVQSISQKPNGKFLGGGTNLVDLMRENIEQPDFLIDVTSLGLDKIEEGGDGSIRIGASVKNSAIINHQLIRERFPVLAQAIAMGASAQLRNMATTAGNLMQRTRCYYFYDTTARCNKREPGAGCDALDGFNRIHAILGASEDCIATHPSDMCVALAALDAIVQVTGTNGQRAIPIVDFHRLPGDTPQTDTNLHPDELITAVELPALPFARNSLYRKVRDRASYAFALVSVAAALAVEDGVIKDARLCLGGVAHKPWRAFAAEKLLVGSPPSETTFKGAAAEELKSARGYRHNSFKIELAQRTILSVFKTLAVEGGAR